jgi:hypothetical protein
MMKTAMIILSSSEIEHFWEVSTPWGNEKIIFHASKVYLCTDVYQNLELAIAECQKDSDAGFNALVIAEPEGASVWCGLPQSIQDQMLANFIPANPHAEFSDRRTAIMASELPGLAQQEFKGGFSNRANKVGGDRSWLNLMMYFSQNPPRLNVSN